MKLNWDSKYHLEKLEFSSGRKWQPVVRETDPTKLFHKLEGVRRRRDTIAGYHKSLVVTRRAGSAAVTAGLLLAVISSLVGVDAGVAAGALIVPGVVALIIGFVAGFSIYQQYLQPMDVLVVEYENLYNDALDRSVRDTDRTEKP
ncbi:hypothetical protein BO226_17570 [Rhodococcus sp. 2G]|uniref:hypothetical protein n=1 Tax=Rhodococcus sp. 2G TaxID=1570939 RepID=UPI000904202C|nr:hypothetical protein [Rhodococcus sp. 2G]APE10782.1 hypothetical protein BO226_17570 [Rhodococcus sp. 2G]